MFAILPFTQFAFAIVQIVLSFICTSLQCSVLPLFFLFTDYRTRVSHQMMFSLGLFDCTQLVTHLVGGLFFVFGAQMPFALGKVMAALNLVGGIAMLIQHVLLALNRLVVICSPILWSSLMESESVEKFFKRAEALLWAAFFVFMVVLQTPLIGGKFDGAVFTIDESLPYSWLFNPLLFYMNICAPGTTLCMYICIFVVIRMSKFRSNQSSTAPSINSKERRMLLQAVILFLGLSLQNFSAVASTVAEEQLLILFLFLYCALNPLLYLAMSKEFRGRFWKTYSIKWTKQSANSTAVVVPNPAVVRTWPASAK